MRKRLFIASSVEGLDVAHAIQENLEYKLEVTVWAQGVFDLSKTTIETIVELPSKFDAAVFVFCPDDEKLVRGESKKSVRDNVIFELGLFIGTIGRENCFIIKPKSFSSLDLPTDLLGVTTGEYDDERDDQNLVAAVGITANKIKQALLLPKCGNVTAPTSIEELLLSQTYRLIFNPQANRSKRMVFGSDGFITEGNNKNEHKWRIINGKLEIIQLDGKVHSRFSYSEREHEFQHTNDSDTKSIRNQKIIPEGN